MFHAPPAKKTQGQSYPTKIHLKVIDISDWHPRKSSSNSLYLHGDLYGRFHILLFSKKNKKNMKLNIQDWSLTSSSIYLVGDIPQWIIFNTLYHSSPWSCIWRCAWAPAKKIICPLGNGLYFQIYKNGGKRVRSNLSQGTCQKSCESNLNWGSYRKKDTTYFKEAFFQVLPLR